MEVIVKTILIIHKMWSCICCLCKQLKMCNGTWCILFFSFNFFVLLASKPSHNALCMTNLHSVCECVACLFAFYCYVDSLKMSQLFHNYFSFIFPSPLVHRWTAFCSMLSPHSTTCCCIRKGQKWQCA